MWTIIGLLLSTLALTQAAGILNITELGVFPTKEERTSAVIVHDGTDSIYVLGGTNGNKYYRTILRFDIRTALFDVVGEFPRSVSGGAGVLDKQSGDIYYFAGGSTNKDIFKVTPSKNGTVSVTVVQSLNVPRVGASAVIVNNAVYIIAGDVSGSYHTPFEVTTVEKFNIATGTVEVVATLNKTISTELRGTSAAYDGQYIHIFGGFTTGYNNIPTALNRILKFNPKTNDIEINGHLPTVIGSSSAVVVGNLIYIIPGVGQYRNAYNGGYIFDPIKQEKKGFKLRDFWSNSLSSSVFVRKQNRIFTFGVTHGYPNIYDRNNQLVAIELAPWTFECNGQADGDYSHPVDCEKYITCSNGYKHERDCQKGLHFDEVWRRCDYPEIANCTP